MREVGTSIYSRFRHFHLSPISIIFVFDISIFDIFPFRYFFFRPFYGQPSALADQCYYYEEREYTYRICMFNDAQQISNGGGAVTIGYYNSSTAQVIEGGSDPVGSEYFYRIQHGFCRIPFDRNPVRNSTRMRSKTIGSTGRIA
jgi:hypothetical protein